jgi:membrane protein DedA with SNARE-associated domain
MFFLSTLFSQAIKFYLLALLIVKFGPEVKKLLEFNLKPIAFTATACIAIVIIAYNVF